MDAQGPLPVVGDINLVNVHIRCWLANPTPLASKRPHRTVAVGGLRWRSLALPFPAPTSPKWILGRVGSELEALAPGAGGDGGANQNAAEQYVCSDMEADSTVASSGSSSFLLTLCHLFFFAGGASCSCYGLPMPLTSKSDEVDKSAVSTTTREASGIVAARPRIPN